MQQTRAIGLAVAMFATIGCVQAQEPQASSSLIVVGDPQLHNYQGGHLFQTTALAARASKVAQRYPEMNLLAAYAFDAGVELATALPGGSPDDPIVLLGDATNVACTGEFDRFMSHVERIRRDGRIFLWAHGNHDTYMVGTTNEYPPTRSSFDDKAFASMKKPLPPDASYWKVRALTHEKAWSNACHDGHGSLPMNKGMWLARYFHAFGSDIDVASARIGDDTYRLTVEPRAGTQLASRNFKMRGRWYAPPEGLTPIQALYKTYDSYVVQAIDVGAVHRLILIDTSTCGGASLTLFDNSGMNGCINNDQIEDIRALSETRRQIVFAGHFPFKELKKADRTRLLAELNRDGRKWTYLSAHTHHRVTQDTRYKAGWIGGYKPLGPSPDEPRFEINFGSTTDWPMEAHRVILDASERGADYVDGGFAKGRKVEYVASPMYTGTEVCRHLDTARQLAAATPEQIWRQPWKVERSAIQQCEQNLEAAQLQLDGYTRTIDEKMKEPSYRDAAFSVLRAASEAFDRK